MTGRERRLLRMLCMTASSGGGGGGGGDKPWEEMTWDEVIAATKNGKYKNFEIGATKELDLGTEGIVHMQIVGIDVDELADGSGYAPLTFLSKELLNTSHMMNPVLTPSEAPYDEGTGSIGGWEKCEMRSYLKDTIKPLIPENVRNAIKTVTKYSTINNTDGSIDNNVVSSDDVWIPSSREVHEDSGTYILAESTGPIYNNIFADYASRIKCRQSGIDGTWYLRSATKKYNCFGIVLSSTGKVTISSAANKNFIALGFCL